MSTSSIVIATVVPVSTAIVAGLGVLVANWNGGRNEHAKWLREQRLEAYSEFLARVDDAATTKTPLDHVKTALKRVRLLGPDRMATLASDIYRVTHEIADASDPAVILSRAQALHEAEDRFTSEARKVLS